MPVVKTANSYIVLHTGYFTGQTRFIAMKHLLCNLFVFSVFIFLSSTASANAAAPLRVEGAKCTAETTSSEMWIGFFKGHRDIFSPLKGGNISKAFSLTRCFKAEVECNSWAYWMQTDFPTGEVEVLCRKGG